MREFLGKVFKQTFQHARCALRAGQGFFAHVLLADDYVSGLWRSTLPQSLLWYTGSFESNDLGYIAPSSSWLSTDCAVTLANRSDIVKKHSVATILHIATKLKYEDAHGPVESSILEWESFLRRVKLSFDGEGDTFELSVLDGDGDDQEMRAIGRSWDEYHGDICKLELDIQLKEPDLYCFCIFITIQQ